MRAAALFSFALVLVSCEAPAARTARLPADSARQDSTARARQDSINRAQPDYIVDSIFPTEVALQRFRASVGGDSAIRLTGGSASITALIERFAAAIATSDTLSLRAMALSAREFADIYYLESPYSRPPYRQPPDFAWRLLQSPSSDGATWLLKEFGGKPLSYVRHSCDRTVVREGRTLRHSACLVTLRDAGGPRAAQRYFGSILERDGQFKFLSYANRN
jgi:hypothetical protein